MQVLAGTSGFSYKEWKGGFYPEKMPPDKMLGFYSGRLPAVEIDSTFYRMPKQEVVESWAGRVPEGFEFAVKAPQVITHFKRLVNVNEELKYFLGVLEGLESRFGCILFQFPAGFRADPQVLKDFLGLLPGTVPCAFDFRSPTWWNDGIYGLLRKKNFSLCLEDREDAPLKSIIETADWGYMRMRREDYTDKTIRSWAKKVLSAKWKKAFVFFKHEEDTSAAAPRLAVRFRELTE